MALHHLGAELQRDARWEFPASRNRRPPKAGFYFSSIRCLICRCCFTRQRGLDEAGYVESFLVLNALGGECLKDFERLREDEGLSEMLGHEVPSSEAARKFLYQFHDETKLEDAQKELPVGQVSYIAEESAPLRALAQVNQEMLQEVGRRCPDQKIATVDLDSTIIESYKREAQPTYQGGSG